jgi:hypothetical protein
VPLHQVAVRQPRAVGACHDRQTVAAVRDVVVVVLGCFPGGGNLRGRKVGVQEVEHAVARPPAAVQVRVVVADGVAAEPHGIFGQRPATVPLHLIYSIIPHQKNIQGRKTKNVYLYRSSMRTVYSLLGPS